MRLTFKFFSKFLSIVPAEGTKNGLILERCDDIISDLRGYYVIIPHEYVKGAFEFIKDSLPSHRSHLESLWSNEDAREAVLKIFLQLEQTTFTREVLDECGSVKELIKRYITKSSETENIINTIVESAKQSDSIIISDMVVEDELNSHQEIIIEDFVEPVISVKQSHTNMEIKEEIMVTNNEVEEEDGEDMNKVLEEVNELKGKVLQEVNELKGKVMEEITDLKGTVKNIATSVEGLKALPSANPTIPITAEEFKGALDLFKNTDNEILKEVFINTLIVLAQEGKDSAVAEMVVASIAYMNEKGYR